MNRILLVVLASFVLCGCASQKTLIVSNPARVSLPALSGWYQDKKIIYVTTDVSDPAIAAIMSANHAPRLTDAISDRPKQPGQKTVLERVYKFTNYQQGSVFASIPQPLGPVSKDVHYSPVWQVYQVTWLDQSQARTLTSDEAIFNMEDAARLKLEATDIIVNCPIIGVEGAGLLPNTWLSN